MDVGCYSLTSAPVSLGAEVRVERELTGGVVRVRALEVVAGDTVARGRAKGASRFGIWNGMGEGEKEKGDETETTTGSGIDDMIGDG